MIMMVIIMIIGLSWLLICIINKLETKIAMTKEEEGGWGRGGIVQGETQEDEAVVVVRGTMVITRI